MPRPSAEALLINALINTGDALGAEIAGITPEMMLGYQTEYRWVLNYNQVYGRCPSRESIQHKFPAFPMTDHQDVPYLLEEVRYAYTKQQMIRVVKNTANYLQEGDLDEAMLTMGSFTPPTLSRPLVNALHDDSFFESYDEPVDSIGMPWLTLDRVTGGMREGDLWYVAARLGQGKTWTLGCMVVAALMQGRDVCLYSLEMPEAQVKTRMHVMLGARLGMDVDHVAMRDRVYDVRQYRRIVGAIKEQVPGALYIKDTSSGRISPVTIQGLANQAQLHVVDYAGLMSSSSGARAIDDWRHMASISNQLKEVSVGKNTRILSAAQINRDGDTTSKHPPKVKNLSQSDALGQDGDVVITHKRYSKSSMVYSVEKSRHGESDVEFWTKFEPNTGDFSEISQDAADDRREAEEYL
jgi:replicative DNA helicase